MPSRQCKTKRASAKFYHREHRSKSGRCSLRTKECKLPIIKEKEQELKEKDQQWGVINGKI